MSTSNETSPANATPPVTDATPASGDAAAAAGAPPVEIQTASPPAPTPPPTDAPNPLEFFGQMVAPIVGQAVEAAIARVLPKAEAPAIPDVEDRAIDDAIARGESAAALINRRAEAIAKRETQALRAEVEQIRNQGTASIAALAEAGLRAKPHFATLEREIGAVLRGMTPAERANPQSLEAAYNYVVGANVEKIVAADRERALRQARDAAPTPGAPGTAGRSAAPPVAMNPNDVFDATELRTIEMAGGLDKMARRMGHKSVDAYVQAEYDRRKGAAH